MKKKANRVIKSIKEAYKWAKKRDSNLKCTDFDLSSFVLIQHTDRSQFLINSAFVEKAPGDIYLGVFSEHHGYRVFEVEELRRWTELSVKDQWPTGY